MKKNILYTMLSLASLLVTTGCGTDSKANSGNTPTSTQGKTASIVCYKIVDEELGPDKYKAHCYVHTVDANSDPINDLIYDVSVVMNVKSSSTGSGTLLTTSPISFSADNKTFIDDGVRKTDTLIILPTEKRHDISYLGNWQITSVNSNQNLSLKEQAFNLETTDELNYVIGNETLYGPNISGSAHIEYPEGNETVVSSSSDDGFFYFTLVFDYQLEGQTAYLAAHTGNNRIGTSRSLLLIIDEEEEETSSDDTTRSKIVKPQIP
jgi:hypothetical protein